MLNKRNHKERIDFWSNHIKKWKESSLSQSEYSRNNNISKQQLSKWKGKIKGQLSVYPSAASYSTTKLYLLYLSFSGRVVRNYFFYPSVDLDLCVTKKSFI